MNSILKICRVGPLLGLITRWHLYRVSRHADAASRSALPRERFRSLTLNGLRAFFQSSEESIADFGQAEILDGKGGRSTDNALR